jgi:hypothetical protein
MIAISKTQVRDMIKKRTRFSTRISSITHVSREKRLRILPGGLVSKNLTGHLNIVDNIFLWSSLDALRHRESNPNVNKKENRNEQNAKPE